MGDYPYDVKMPSPTARGRHRRTRIPIPQGDEAVQYAYYWLTDQQDMVEQPDHFLPLPIVTAENVDEYPAAWGDPRVREVSSHHEP